MRQARERKNLLPVEKNRVVLNRGRQNKMKDCCIIPTCVILRSVATKNLLRKRFFAPLRMTERDYCATIPMKKCRSSFRNNLCLIGTLVSFLCGVAAYAQEASQVSAFLSPEGKVFFGDASNSLLIIDYPENVQDIEDYLKMIDQPPAQVLIEARVVEVKLSGEHSLGINWNAFRQAGMLPSFGGRGLSGETTSSAISQAIPYKSTLFPPAT